MSSFERFRELNNKRRSSQASLNTHFIFKGYPSIMITSDQDEESCCQAVIVNQQEKDKAYIYTQLVDELPMGTT